MAAATMARVRRCMLSTYLFLPENFVPRDAATESVHSGTGNSLAVPCDARCYQLQAHPGRLVTPESPAPVLRKATPGSLFREKLYTRYYYATLILVAVMLPSLLCVPITLMWLPTVTALADADLPFSVYVVLAVVWTITVVPL
jgi:hypothetical protein